MTTLRQLYRTILLNDTPKAKAIRVSQGLHSYIAPTRVKRRTCSQTHVKARLCDSVKPERGANKGDNGMGFTPKLPRGDL